MGLRLLELFRVDKDFSDRFRKEAASVYVRLILDRVPKELIGEGCPKLGPGALWLLMQTCWLGYRNKHVVPWSGLLYLVWENARFLVVAM